MLLSKEIDMMRLQSEDDTHQKKGNSLFGEVSVCSTLTKRTFVASGFVELIAWCIPTGGGQAQGGGAPDDDPAGQVRHP